MKRDSSKILGVIFLAMAALPVKAQKINVSLEINESKETTIYQNESVLMDVAVFSRKAQADRRWNMAGEERMNELNELLRQGKIKQEDYDSEKAGIEKNKRSVQSIELGSATSSWTSAVSWKVMNTANGNEINLPIRLLKKPSTEGKAVLDADGYYLACYGISPEDMKTVSAGTYAIECLVNNIPTASVVLKVQNGMMDTGKAGADASLLRTGQYYWHNENGDKTVEYAERLLAKNPASLDALSLKADGQYLQNQYEAAMASYKKAAAEYYRQNGAGAEPPEYLLMMIDVVKKKLGQ